MEITLSPRTNSALEAAYKTHYGRICSYLRRALQDKARAEDLAVETFIVYARKLEEGEQIEEESNYLTVIAGGLLDNELKRLARSKEEPADGTPEGLCALVDGPAEHDPWAEPTKRAEMLWPHELTIEDAEFRVDFDRAVRGLPKDERDAFILGELRGLASREAGEILGVSHREVQLRQESARARIKHALT